jgi:hypothetical protein
MSTTTNTNTLIHFKVTKSLQNNVVYIPHTIMIIIYDYSYSIKAVQVPRIGMTSSEFYALPITNKNRIMFQHKYSSKTFFFNELDDSLNELYGNESCTGRHLNYALNPVHISHRLVTFQRYFPTNTWFMTNNRVFCSENDKRISCSTYNPNLGSINRVFCSENDKRISCSTYNPNLGSIRTDADYFADEYNNYNHRKPTEVVKIDFTNNYIGWQDFFQPDNPRLFIALMSDDNMSLCVHEYLSDGSLKEQRTYSTKENVVLYQDFINSCHTATATETTAEAIVPPIWITQNKVLYYSNTFSKLVTFDYSRDSFKMWNMDFSIFDFGFRVKQRLLAKLRIQNFVLDSALSNLIIVIRNEEKATFIIRVPLNWVL